ncbi:MAG: tripartite tricarboxylate transporter substrate binding protein [Rhodospirillales bacterium]|nr:tripartite tricarboxylate transporter substrate binding protein [Rhodospirillales bacterium]MBT4039994.1 tripartite tricarboxylate transporter substrate binding protein [Rhodospirillales bacterium]MBT4625836.1 tripartite tricarboxylate transporter substrate binding protein [Rhodospirillales bacterium]MBT5351656.1 tripartite tricarboxylate transporter substrate binding protein [Rhodospirillales bacterium]MBT5521333.1 tripartite tricarboxylate transporter substrate binding protein [Rhodospiril
MKFGKKLLGLGVAAAVGIGMTVSSVAINSAEAGWAPKKPIEFVIMAGKGGGADKMARLLQTVIEKNGWSSKPLTPINKPGGSGAEALVHLNNASDPDHTIMVTLNSFYTTPMRQPKLGVNIETFTPIARMAEDTFLLWVNKDSGITNVEEFVSAAKAKGGDWIMAGTGKLSEDNLLTDFLNAAYGLDMKYVPYKGGGKVAKQLAGNHADSTVNNPSEQEGFYAAGTTVPLAAFTDNRLAMFPDAPTFGELGKDFVYYMQRSVVGAPGMSAGAAEYYQKLFAQVFASEEWSAYRTKKSLQGDLLQGDALMSYWMNERDVHEAMLRKMGALD